MTNYNIAKDVARHSCTSDLAQLKQSAYEPDTWLCDCGSTVGVPLWDVVEILRVRAVAQDAASRVHRLRSAPEPVPGSVVGHAPAEHAYFAPLIPPVRLREQGGL